ncbi:putative neprosin [Helianthus annuus]|uniref:Neprosin n=2 Tax=Helianthus annuus TaxID=4232 RepID=A0A251U2Q3_HELAN|nr:putative neprosin [Helianthus annuus]KAJ0537343.1 putative neprosin [Helianthus annuus]KAJ0551924.1 putative neprosin [Helianthus annuus]KAJ0717625.1 putative neprosin [Helianthus annuus]KAJ0720842.1 putative neprosin [Helianthus annuus]
MKTNSCLEIPSNISVLVLFSLLFSPIFSSMNFREENETTMAGNKSKNMKLINDHLRKINKPFVKSIKSPDGDIIDCVLFHLQPAFDLPELKNKISVMVQPELPKEHDHKAGTNPEIKQLWNLKGESCPNGTIPIKRTSAGDILRTNSIPRFGKKYSRNDVPPTPGHEHSIGSVREGEFYGAKAILNVWKPNVIGLDFSVSQIWVVAHVPTRPVNTVEVGWHVFPNVYKDNLPRLFAFWTPDGYQSGCYNLECPGFIQINPNVCLGASIKPISTYNGKQYEIALLIWKDPNSGDWWLRVGTEVIGFWPAELFTDLQDRANRIDYGGEVYAESLGKHTSTQMGSGHFPDEGFGKAAFARNLEMVDQDNYLNEVSNLNLYAEKANCYGINNGHSDAWGNYIFFGGPGYNPNCL